MSGGASAGRAAVCLLGLALAFGAAGVRARSRRTEPGPGAGSSDPTPATLALGGRGSPHRLVIWSDYECPACGLLDRVAGDELHDLAGSGALRIEIRHFPLSAHRRAPRAAAAAVCAERQGRGWAMHEALFRSTPTWSSGPPARPWFAHLADSLGLDPAALAACSTDPETEGALAADLARGRALGLIAVPTVFLDGRPLRYRTPEALVRRVRRTVALRRP